MRALFAKGAAHSSPLRQLDARTKLTVTAAAAILTVASSGMVAQLVIFAVTLILTYAGGFNMLAAYNLQSTFSGYSFYDPATTPWVIGAVLAVVVSVLLAKAVRPALRPVCGHYTMFCFIPSIKTKP